MRRLMRNARAIAVIGGMALLAVTAVPVGAAPEAGGVSADGDAVIEWNQHASDALINSPTAATPGFGQPPQVAVVHMGIVQGAVYDAVNSIHGGYQPYLSGLPAVPRSASQASAAATAAHHVLVGFTIQGARMLPQSIVDRLDVLYADAIADATATDGSEAVADGIAAGQAAADAMLAARADDGRYPPGTSSFPVGFGIGEWRPVEPSYINDPNAWVADVTPLMVLSSSQFRTRGPHPIGSGAYVREYNEVKTLGGDGVTTPSGRTPEQDAIANFYRVHPIELYNRTFRTIATDEELDLAEQARLFAMINMTAADTQINCWDDKRFWSFWRPITAIRDADADGNRRTQGDPNWTPLLPTPPYPEHPSGFNCVTSGFMYGGAAFFGGQRMDFSVVKRVAGEPDVVREYERFRDVLADAVEARILQGIHFRAADVQAARAGQQVAAWVKSHYFRPVH